MIPAFFALLLAVSEYFGVLSSRTPKTPRWPGWLLVAILAASYALQLLVVLYAARHQWPSPSWRAAMPLAVVDDRGPVTSHGDLVAAAMLLLAALQSYVLLAVYRTRMARAAVAGGCALLLALSLAAPALLSFDAYGYVHDALLGLAAYRPPAGAFTGEYRVFDWWFTGPNSTLYGPLWLAIVRVVTTCGTTLSTKLLAWRAFCALAYVASIVALRALGMPARIVNAFALNPGLMLQFVANGHNDVLAVAVLALTGAIVRRGQGALGFATAAVAGLIKLPYVVLGMPIFAKVRPVPARIAGAALALAAVAAVSWFGGGSAYLGALTGHVGSAPANLVHRLAGVAALAAIALAFAGGRRLRTGVWLVPMLGAHLYSWYCIWGFGYAMQRRRILGYLFVCFPFVAMMVESAIERVWILLGVLPAAALLSIFAPERRRSVRRLAAGEAPA